MSRFDPPTIYSTAHYLAAIQSSHLIKFEFIPSSCFVKLQELSKHKCTFLRPRDIPAKQNNYSSTRVCLYTTRFHLTAFLGFIYVLDFPISRIVNYVGFPILSAWKTGTNFAMDRFEPFCLSAFLRVPQLWAASSHLCYKIWLSKLLIR